MTLDLDRKSCTIFRVSRWENSQWEVKEKGFEKSLGSFNSEKDACSRASDLARARPGSRVVSEERSLIGTLHLPAMPRLLFARFV